MDSNWSARRPHIQRTPGEEFLVWREYARTKGKSYANAIHGLYRCGILLVSVDFQDEHRGEKEAILFEIFSFCGQHISTQEQRMRMIGFAQQFMYGTDIEVFRLRQNERMAFVRYSPKLTDAQRRQSEPLKFAVSQLKLFDIHE